MTDKIYSQKVMSFDVSGKPSSIYKHSNKFHRRLCFFTFRARTRVLTYGKFFDIWQNVAPQLIVLQVKCIIHLMLIDTSTVATDVKHFELPKMMELPSALTAKRTNDIFLKKQGRSHQCWSGQVSEWLGQNGGEISHILLCHIDFSGLVTME